MKKLEYFMNYLLEHKSLAIEQSIRSTLPKGIINGLLLFSVIGFGIFGFTIGSSHSVGQGAVSMIKLPLLFYITTSVCFPTLYLFLALMGMNIGFRGMAQFTLICLTLMGTILVAFSPISLFFSLTFNDADYIWFKLINVGLLAIAGFSGVYLFYRHLLMYVPENFGYWERYRVRLFIRAWLILYGIIGANLGFSISPVFGDPHQIFMFFTDSQENFFTHIINALSRYYHE